MLGIIGGTGIYSLGKFTELQVNTPYGFANVYVGKISGEECAFIPRHGKDHGYPPHKINYRANIWALNRLGVNGVLATYACGIIPKAKSLKVKQRSVSGRISKYKPGDLIIAEDFIGLFSPITFYDDFKSGIKHVDFSEPYDKGMKARLFSAAKNAGLELKKGGIIVTTHGPRFETKSEVKMLAKMGANLVSMTNAYETTLLHELEIACAGLCIATNYACGNSKKPLSHSEVVAMMGKKEKDVNSIIREFAKLL